MTFYDLGNLFIAQHQSNGIILKLFSNLDMFVDTTLNMKQVNFDIYTAVFVLLFRMIAA